MTEEEWLTRDRPTEMLSALWDYVGHTKPRYYPDQPGARIPTHRKLRLLGAACAGLIPNGCTAPSLPRMAEAVERLADSGFEPEPGNQCREPWWTEPVKEAQHQWHAIPAAERQWELAGVALNLGWDRANEEPSVREVLRATWALGAPSDVLARLVRDIFANPFRPLPVIEPAWRAWHDGTLVKIAHALYEQRRFEEMPILADALEEAGCDDEAILSHCRSAGQHWRGCWVIDRILDQA